MNDFIMLWIVSLLFTLPICAALRFAQEKETRQRLQGHGDNLISFISRESRTSKEFESEWETVENDMPIAFSVDCSTAGTLCTALDIVSYPTIRLYRKGTEMLRYRGPRKSKDITAFVQRSLQPKVSEVLLSDVKDFSASDEIVMLMHLSKNNKSLFQRMGAFALQYYDRYSFGATFAADRPKAVCYNNIDGTRHVAEHLESLDALQRLLARCVEPLIPALTRRNEVKYLSGGKSLVYYFNISSIARKEYTDEMNSLAKTYQEYLTLVTVDSGEYPAMPANLGLKSGTGLVVQNVHNGQAFPYEGDITAEKIEAFIVAISEGKVSAWHANADQAGTVVRDEL